MSVTQYDTENIKYVQEKKVQVMHLRAGVLTKLVIFADMQNQVHRTPWVELFAVSLPGPSVKQYSYAS